MRQRCRGRGAREGGRRWQCLCDSRGRAGQPLPCASGPVHAWPDGLPLPGSRLPTRQPPTLLPLPAAAAHPLRSPSKAASKTCSCTTFQRWERAAGPVPALVPLAMEQRACANATPWQGGGPGVWQALCAGEGLGCPAGAWCGELSRDIARVLRSKLVPRRPHPFCRMRAPCAGARRCGGGAGRARERGLEGVPQAGAAPVDVRAQAQPAGLSGCFPPAWMQSRCQARAVTPAPPKQPHALCHRTCLVSRFAPLACTASLSACSLALHFPALSCMHHICTLLSLSFLLPIDSKPSQLSRRRPRKNACRQ